MSEVISSWLEFRLFDLLDPRLDDARLDPGRRKTCPPKDTTRILVFAGSCSAGGTPIDDSRRARPSGVYTDDLVVGGLTRRGACTTDRLTTLCGRLTEGAHGRLGRRASSLGGTLSDSKTLDRSRRVCTSTHSNEGRGGETKKEGMGMCPGRRTRRSAQRYPAWIWSTRGASSAWGIGSSETISNMAAEPCS
jgi:hypothetical protein